MPTTSIDNQGLGASAGPTGLSPSVEPSSTVSTATAASIPSAFTPGPWRLVKMRGGQQHVVSPHSVSIAALGFCTSPDATAANARLIAAAPELYEALCKLTAATAYYRITHDTLGDGHIDTGRAWDAMRKAEKEATEALAKARGEA